MRAFVSTIDIRGQIVPYSKYDFASPAIRKGNSVMSTMLCHFEGVFTTEKS